MLNGVRSTRRARASGAAIALICSVFLGTLAVAPADAAPLVDVYTGSVDGFYVVPDPLPAGSPGEVIRVMDVASTASTVTQRIMYHSVDGAGRDRAVTGTITYPTGPAPSGGWPVLTIANGTVGLGSQCAPSRTSMGPYGWGLDAVIVDSDYIGSGPAGEVQAYLSRPSEGHSVLDAVRAARNLSATHAGDDILILGGSQGGHGALSASELAATYAPELHLLGTVALAPAALFDRVYGGIDPFVTRVVGAMGFRGLMTEHPEIDPSDYLTPAGLAAMNQIGGMCTSDITTTVLGVPFDGFYSHDPTQTEPARSIMLANDVGNVEFSAPLLLVQGLADTTVVPERTRDLYSRICATGQTVEYREVAGATHENVGQVDGDAIRSWLTARLDHAAPTDTCGQPLSPLHPTPTTPPPAPQPGTTPHTAVSPVAIAVPARPTYTG